MRGGGRCGVGGRGRCLGLESWWWEKEVVLKSSDTSTQLCTITDN